MALRGGRPRVFAPYRDTLDVLCELDRLRHDVFALDPGVVSFVVETPRAPDDVARDLEVVAGRIMRIAAAIRGA